MLLVGWWEELLGLINLSLIIYTVLEIFTNSAKVLLNHEIFIHKLYPTKSAPNIMQSCVWDFSR